jgi:spoIIIJ-associated protein
MESKLEDWLKELLGLMQLKPKAIAVSKDESGTYQAQLDVEAEDAGALIGYHGDTIAALQLISGVAMGRLKTEKDLSKEGWDRVVINVNDYRQQRQASLEQTAQDTAEKVKQSGEPIALFNLNPFERRQVHMILAEDKKIVTVSEGEGTNRHLIVSPAPATSNE